MCMYASEKKISSDVVMLNKIKTFTREEKVSSFKKEKEKGNEKTLERFLT